MDSRTFPKSELQTLLDFLWSSGQRVLGPVERDATVVLDEVRRTEELPIGRRDRQGPGTYLLEDGEPNAVFGVVHGPDSLKKLFFPATEPLISLRREGRGFRVTETLPESQALTVIGVRACDLAGAAVQDRIFLHDHARDSHYAVRRGQVTIVAVACTRSLSTCFCTSMDTGPRARGSHDLELIELDDAFVASAHSDRGAALLAAVDAATAPVATVARAEAAVDRCASAMERRLDTDGLRELLVNAADHPHWEEVAQRCLSCANCTMVCPTCFCHRVDDVADLRDATTERVRAWASCFTPEHGQIHGKNFRPHTRDRYRQWLTHKLSTWIDQFGTSGCVGCGRCITWCPVGIDLTSEVAALRRPAEGAR